MFRFRIRALGWAAYRQSCPQKVAGLTAWAVARGMLAVLPLALLVTIAAAQPPPMEIIRSKCDVMQDVVDDLIADHADLERVKRRDDDISGSILSRLAASDLGRVERLFKCFDFRERTEFGAREMWGRIPVATLNIPTTSDKRVYAQVRVNAWIFITKKFDGSVQIRGEYRADY